MFSHESIALITLFFQSWLWAYLWPLCIRYMHSRAGYAGAG